MNARVRWRLAAMMALVYAIQGAWWPLLSVHLADLGIAGPARGWIFATLAMASMAMPLGAGRLVDRAWPAQRALSLIFGLGSLGLIGLALGAVSTAGPMFAWFLAYWFVVAPGFGVSTALAMRNLADPAREFAGVRLWGTVGWMAIGYVVSAAMILAGSTAASQGAYVAFWIAAALSIVLAALATRLPNTPPLDVEPDATGSALTHAWELIRRPGVGPYLAVAFAVNLTIPFVYQVVPTYLVARGLPRAWLATAMTLGQWPEIAALAVLPWMLGRLGERRTLAVGIASWMALFLGLAAGAPLWLAVAAIPLHGVGTACFSIAGQLFLDARAPTRRRAGAQALHMVATSGLGSLLGSLLGGLTTGWLGAGDPRVFLVPGLIDLAVLGYVVVEFRPPAADPDGDGRPHRSRGAAGLDGPRGVPALVGQLATEMADG